MSTITTKQLRENMSRVILDLQRGKSVQLSYRHKVIGVLRPIESPPSAQRRGSAAAIQHFLRTAGFGDIPPELQHSSRSFKKEIADLRNRGLASK